MKLKFSIRAVLILFGLLGGIFAFIYWNDPVTRYRRDHDAASLRAILSRRAKNGDTIARIQDLLGPAPSGNDEGFRWACRMMTFSKRELVCRFVAETDVF